MLPAGGVIGIGITDITLANQETKINAGGDNIYGLRVGIVRVLISRVVPRSLKTT